MLLEVLCFEFVAPLAQKSARDRLLRGRRIVTEIVSLISFCICVFLNDRFTRDRILETMTKKCHHAEFDRY